MEPSPNLTKKDLFKLSALGAVVASLCCITPIILVLFGVASVSAAAALGNTLYFGYRWAFGLVSLITIVVALVFYFRKKGVCTLDQAKKQRTRIINTFLLIFVVTVIVYIFFNYVILEFIGYWMGIWGVPYLGLEVLPSS